MGRVHGECVRPPLVCMQERTDFLMHRLDGTGLSEKTASEKMDALIPKLEEFLQNSLRSSELQLAGVTRSLLQLSEAVSGLTPDQDPRQDVPPLSPRYTSLGLIAHQNPSSATAGCSPFVPQPPFLPREEGPLKSDANNLPHAWGGQIESTFAQSEGGGFENEDSLGRVKKKIQKEWGAALLANKVEWEDTQRDFLEAVQSMVAVTHQEVVGLVGAVTTEMEKLRTHMDSVFLEVVELRRLAGEEEEEIEDLRRDFQAGFVQSSLDLNTSRESTTDPVNVLVEAIMDDRVQSKRVAAAVAEIL